MKKIVFACAIVLICLNITSCTEVPISESSTEQSTGGGEAEENDDPNRG